VIHAPEGAGAIWRGAHRLPHQSQVTGRDLFAETLARNTGLVSRLLAFSVDPSQRCGYARGPYRILVQENAGTPCTAFVTGAEMRAWLRAYGLRIHLQQPQPWRGLRLFRFRVAAAPQPLRRALPAY
jgi:hypothetical protein